MIAFLELARFGNDWELTTTEIRLENLLRHEMWVAFIYTYRKKIEKGKEIKKKEH